MRYSTIAVIGLAAVAQATWDGKFTYPPGIEPLGLASGNADFSIKTFGPAKAPPSDCISVWHPPHPDVYIDNCDSDKDHGWHWVHPGKPSWDKPGKDHDKPHKSTDQPQQSTGSPDQPQQPQPATTTTPEWKWTTSTITQTAISTVFSCAPSVTNCPARGGGGGGMEYTTVTVPAVVTICPVPVNPVPTTPVPVAPPAPTTAVPVAPPAAPTQPAPSPAPPATLSSVVVPPVSSAPPAAQPAAPPAPNTTTPANIGTVTRPNPTATSGHAIVTAAAVPNAQRAGGVLVAAVAVAAVFV